MFILFLFRLLVIQHLVLTAYFKIIESRFYRTLFHCRKAKKSGSNIFAMFSQRQIQEFKEAFGIMDCDKNGLLSADDLVSAFSAVGKSISGGEADNMLSESPGPVNFTQMVTLFAEKMAGGNKYFLFILFIYNLNIIGGKFSFLPFLVTISCLGTDDDDTILKSFDAFEIAGKIDAEM